MKKLQYLFVYIWIAIPSAIQIGVNILYGMGYNYSLPSTLELILRVCVPIPIVIPWLVRTFLLLLIVIISLYRILVFIKTIRKSLPQEYFGVACIFSKIGFYSFLTFLFLLIATILLTSSGGSSGVPAALSLIPAIICTPISFFIIEFKILKKAWKMKNIKS